MVCLTSARYTMTMDVYYEVTEQTESGQILRDWALEKAGVPCIARSVQGLGIRVVGSTERWGNDYDNVEIVKIQTKYLLSKRSRIRNIRDAAGNLTWQEGGTDIICEVLGSIPIIDGFGNLLEYDVMTTRADPQTLST